MLRRPTLSLLVVTCLGHILLISAQVQSRSGLPIVEALAFDGFAAVQHGMEGIGRGIHDIWAHYLALHGAAVENDALKQQVFDLSTKLEEAQALVARTHALEEALGLRASQAAPTIVARVIAGNPSPSSWTVTLDRGSDDGVTPDMAVISARGVVGRVIAPLAPHAATVQLLIGRQAAAAVTFERANAGGIALGGGSEPVLRAEYVPVLANVQVGERVVTSGQDGIYPSGYLVGVVERVVAPGTPDRQIVIRPAVDFSHLDVVLIVLAHPQPATGGPS